MKNTFTFILLLFVMTSGFAQINIQDSTVQVITFWDLGEKYDYSASLQKLKYTDTDTTSNETMTYDVEVSVIDSTEKSYVVRWFYKNFKSDAKDALTQRLSSVAEDIAVDVRLNEVGIVEGVENWEEVRDYMAKSVDTMVGDFGELPGLDKIMGQIKAMYSTKGGVEGTAIKDVVQFHNFHGAAFKLDEKLEGQMKMPNLYNPEKPFDSNFSIILEEIDTVNYQYTMRSFQEVDSEQLTQTTFEFLNEMAKNMDMPLLKKEDFTDLSNTTETVSLIHNTGWVVESVQWKEVKVEGNTTEEIRKIWLK